MHYYFSFSCAQTLFLLHLCNNSIITQMRIKEVIKEKGLTSAQVAKRMGIVPEALSRVINGNPTVKMLERVATAIGVPVTELFEKPTSGGFVCPSCGATLVADLRVVEK